MVSYIDNGSRGGASSSLNDGVSCCGRIRLTVDWIFITSEICSRLVLLIAAIIIFAFVDPFVREVWPTEWPDYAMPYAVHEMFPMWLVTVLLICVPLVLLIGMLCALHIKFRWRLSLIVEEAMFFLLAYTLALIVGFILCEFVKRLFGRLRPDYLNRCMGYIPSDLSVIPVIPDCSGSPYDQSTLSDGRMSFPSEHSTLSWAAFLFCALWFYGKLCLFYNTGAIRLCAPFAILFIPMAISITRSCDYRHHVSDIIGGTLFGIFIAIVCYCFYWPIQMKPLMADVYSVFESSQQGQKARLRDVTAARLRVRDEGLLISDEYQLKRQMYFQGAILPALARQIREQEQQQVPVPINFKDSRNDIIKDDHDHDDDDDGGGLVNKAQ